MWYSIVYCIVVSYIGCLFLLFLPHSSVILCVFTHSLSLSLQNMCMLESELENQLGEFHIKMKGKSVSAFVTRVIMVHSTRILKGSWHEYFIINVWAQMMWGPLFSCIIISKNHVRKLFELCTYNRLVWLYSNLHNFTRLTHLLTGNVLHCNAQLAK